MQTTKQVTIVVPIHVIKKAEDVAKKTKRPDGLKHA